MRKILFLIAGFLYIGFLASCEPINSGFEIVNLNSNYAVQYVWITPSTSSSWGNDLLGGSMILPGANRTFLFGPATYDVSIELTTGDYVDLYGIAVIKDEYRQITVTDTGVGVTRGILEDEQVLDSNDFTADKTMINREFKSE